MGRRVVTPVRPGSIEADQDETWAEAWAGTALDAGPTASLAVNLSALPTQIVATVNERDIDLLILEEFAASSAFRSWWLSEVGYDAAESHQYVGVWHSLPDAAGESDLVLLVADHNGER
jgi:hypothetical protein